jgi:hypothetical protein
MKLNFMGQSYSLLQQQVATIASENTACFRGQRYKLRVPVAISQVRSRPTQLTAVVQKYRGVSYITLGNQFYEKPKESEHCYR